ncbi:MAG: SelB C-terminal domain-containing protein [Enterocloster sp.]
MLTAFHQANPIAAGMEKEEFKSRILESFYLKEAKKGDVLLNELLKRGIISASGSTVAAAGFSAQYSDEHSDMRQTMIKTYAAAGFEAPSTDEVMAQFKDKKQAKQVLSDLFKDGTLVKLNPGAYLYKDHYEKAMELLRGHFVSHDTMSLAEFRDMLGTSRKYVLLILDHLDQQKITKLQGDVRVLLK